VMSGERPGENCPVRIMNLPAWLQKKGASPSQYDGEEGGSDNNKIIRLSLG